MDIQILLIFVFVCALADLRCGRIPNPLTAAGLSCALFSRVLYMCHSRVFPHIPLSYTPFPYILLQRISYLRLSGFFASQSPVISIADCVIGGLIPFILLGPLAVRRMIGGGDVKLLAVIGIQLGAAISLRVIWYSIVFAALWCVILVIRRRNLIRRLMYLQQYISIAAAAKKAVPYRSGEDDASGEFCFAPAVFCALAVILSMQ